MDICMDAEIQAPGLRQSAASQQTHLDSGIGFWDYDTS